MVQCSVKRFFWERPLKSTTVIMEQANRNARFDIKLWGWSLLSLVPFAINSGEKIRRPTTINKELKRYAHPRKFQTRQEGNPVRFRPYVSKVPWHKGPRAFLSQLFPRYGHYCGPNWSSGKNSGSNLWDMRPMDWLDYCCYCHDIGYDTHDQAELLKADLAFLDCLERPHMDTRGDAHVAHLYKTMCITGMSTFFPVIFTVIDTFVLQSRFEILFLALMFGFLFFILMHDRSQEYINTIQKTSCQTTDWESYS